MIDLKPAVKELKTIKILSYGPTYSGKTLSSLLIAAGIVMAKRQCTEQEAYAHVVLIDTEYGRGALHNKVGPYNYLRIDPPYHTERLVAMLTELNTMPEVDVVIVDSLTHFWVKEGGILEQKAAKDKTGGNSYTNWLDYTAKFTKLIDTILASPKHVLVTARAKTDTALVLADNGKSTPRTYGLKPELRDGIDFDFDIVFNVDKQTHALIIDKTLPGVTETFYDAATPALGVQLYGLFQSDAVITPRTAVELINSIRVLSKTHDLVTYVQLELSGRRLDQLTLEELTAFEKKVVEKVAKDQVNAR